MLGATFVQIPQLLVELRQILEISIDRSETDIGDVVTRLESVHHQLTDDAALYFRGVGPVQRTFDVVDDFVDLIAGDGPLRRGHGDAREKLPAIVWLDLAVALLHLQRALLDVLVSRVPPPALQAFATSAHGAALATRARIDYPVLHVTTERTSHGS